MVSYAPQAHRAAVRELRSRQKRDAGRVYGGYSPGPWPRANTWLSGCARPASATGHRPLHASLPPRDDRGSDRRRSGSAESHHGARLTPMRLAPSGWAHTATLATTQRADLMNACWARTLLVGLGALVHQPDGVLGEPLHRPHNEVHDVHACCVRRRRIKVRQMRQRYEKACVEKAAAFSRTAS